MFARLDGDRSEETEDPEALGALRACPREELRLLARAQRCGLDPDDVLVWLSDQGDLYDPIRSIQERRPSPLNGRTLLILCAEESSEVRASSRENFARGMGQPEPTPLTRIPLSALERPLDL